MGLHKSGLLHRLSIKVRFILYLAIQVTETETDEYRWVGSVDGNLNGNEFYILPRHGSSVDTKEEEEIMFVETINYFFLPSFWFHSLLHTHPLPLYGNFASFVSTAGCVLGLTEIYQTIKQSILFHSLAVFIFFCKFKILLMYIHS